MSCPKLTPLPIIIRTGTRSPKEVEKAKALVAEAIEITVTIVETTRLHINIHLKEN